MNHVLLGKHGSVKSLRECDRNWNMSNVVGVKKFIIIIIFFTQDGEDTSINNAMAGLLNISRYKILFFFDNIIPKWMDFFIFYFWGKMSRWKWETLWLRVMRSENSYYKLLHLVSPIYAHFWEVASLQWTQ